MERLSHLRQGAPNNLAGQWRDGVGTHRPRGGSLRSAGNPRFATALRQTDDRAVQGHLLEVAGGGAAFLVGPHVGAM